MSLEEYLREITLILKQDHPSEFQDVLGLLAKDAILIGLDDEKTIVRVQEGQIQFCGADRAGEVDSESSITRSLMFSLLDGKTTLAEAIRNPEFTTRGSPEAILRLYKMMEIVLRISQRSAKFIDLQNRFRYTKQMLQ